MDAYTKAKREQDGICRLAQVEGSSTTQKLTALRKQQKELLQQQAEVSRHMHRRLGNDIAQQTSIVKDCHHAIKQSRQPGPVKCKEPVGGRIAEHSEYANQIENLKASTGSVNSIAAEITALERAERVRQAKGGEAVNSMAAWFARYGEPKRQSQPEEKSRSCVMKPRRKPYDGFSHAVTLRKGWLTK